MRLNVQNKNDTISLQGYLTTKPGEDTSTLMSAVMCADLRAVRDIIAEGADVNEVGISFYLC